MRTLLFFFILASDLSAQLAKDLTVEDMRVEQRVALVIGNAAYQNAPLRNPINDARSMTDALRRCGFQVIEKLNCNKMEMKEAIRTFGEQIHRGGIGLFYYSGHGVQVEGRNYLIPISADIQQEHEVDDECIDAGRVLGEMEAAHNRISIVILDACRNNPFARNFRSEERGLAWIDAAKGSLVAFATAPGSVASDGPGVNGLYTSVLLKHLFSPGLKIEEIFKEVRKEVTAVTKDKQIPWESSSLTGDFYFVLPNLEPGQGKLYVDSNPRGARIFLDDVEQIGMTPATLATLAGVHRVRLEKDRMTWSGEVQVQSNHLVRVSENLTLEVGKVIVVTTPPAVEVYLDNQLQGHSPLQIDSVTPTKHRVRLTGEWVMGQEQEITVSRDRTTRVEADLEPAGLVEVESEPAGALVVLDDRQIGRSPQKIKIRPGEYRVALLAEDYESTEVMTIVRAGMTVQVREQLLYKYGSLNVETTPAGAKVVLGEIGLSGIAPVLFEQVPQGTHDVWVTLNNYQEQVCTVTVNRGQRTDLPLKMDFSLDFCSAATGLKMGLSVLGAGKGSLTHWSGPSRPVRSSAL